MLWLFQFLLIWPYQTSCFTCDLMATHCYTKVINPLVFKNILLIIKLSNFGKSVFPPKVLRLEAVFNFAYLEIHHSEPAEL